MTVPSADEILGLEGLKTLRADVTMAQPEEGTPPETYFRFLVIMSAVQDMRAWSRLAEPGLGPKVAALGWDAEVEGARAMDRRNLEARRGAVRGDRWQARPQGGDGPMIHARSRAFREPSPPRHEPSWGERAG